MSRGTDKLSLLLGCKMIRLSLESSRLQAAQRDALNAEHSNIRGNLNIDTMVQFLNSKSLLTSDESYWLMDTNRPWGKRVDFLVEILPRKERNWWDKFLWCLDESSARPGLAVHKELANQLRDQLNQQTIKYERCNLMWLLIKCMKRFTVRHQKTAFKIGTIIALLVVALCILLRSNTLIINNEISADNISESLLMSGTRHTTHKFVSNCSDKVDVVTDSSVKDDTTLHKDATQNFMSTNDSQSANLNKAHNSEKAESRPNNNSTSHKLVTSQKSSNERSITIQNTSEYAVAPEVSVGRVYHLKNLTTAPPNDKKVMQKQLNMTHCLLYYIEKEKLEYAELDLWRVYIALNAIPPNVTTTTETHLLSVIEGLTAWNIADLTIRNSIARQVLNKLSTN